MILTAVVAGLLGLGSGWLIVWRWPQWFARSSVFHPAVEPRWMLAWVGVVTIVGLWTAISFWQGTRYSRFTGNEVTQLTHSFADVDLSVRQMNRGIADFTRQVTESVCLIRRPESKP